MATLLETSNTSDLEQLTEDKLFPPQNSPVERMELPSGMTEEAFVKYLDQKERAMKAKCIALELLGHHPLSNPSKFSRREKDKVLNLMTIWFNKSDEELTAEFNDVITDKVLSETSPYENYAIANNAITFADPPPRNDVMDIAGNVIEPKEPAGLSLETPIPYGIL
jgi:hypothetical protein